MTFKGKQTPEESSGEWDGWNRLIGIKDLRPDFLFRSISGYSEKSREWSVGELEEWSFITVIRTGVLFPGLR